MIISIVIFCSVSHAYAQSPQKIEQELLRSFKQLQNTAKDSIGQANKAFKNSLLAYTASIKATFTYEFKELEREGLIIRSSEDGLFRIYSWDTGSGSTEHRFDAVYQYRAGNDVFSQLAQRRDEDAGKWYSNIYTLKTETKTYYIGLYNEMYSSIEYAQGVKVFCIEEKDLNKGVRLFKTPDGLKNEMGFKYNFLSVAHRPERPAKLIYYDADEDKLQFTVVQQDGKVTRDIVTWLFTGKYFELVKRR